MTLPVTLLDHPDISVTSPVRLPVTSPVTSPVRLPVTSPVTSPVRLPVTSPVRLPVTLPVRLPVIPNVAGAGALSDVALSVVNAPVLGVVAPIVGPSMVPPFIVGFVKAALVIVEIEALLALLCQKYRLLQNWHQSQFRQ